MSRPLSFLHLSTFYPPYSFGGDATFLHRLCHLLGDAGHHVDVVHCVDSFQLGNPEPPRLDYQEHPNVRRHELRSRFGALSPLLTQQTGRPFLKYRKIRELMSQHRYDVVHFHNTSLLGPKSLTLRPTEGEFVKLYTMHEHWLVCPMHVLWKYDRQACDKPACLRCTLHGKRPVQLWRYTGLLERSCQHVDQFIAPSQFTADMHRERGFGQPVKVLPHFVGAPAESAEKDSESATPYFLFVGRLEKIKGLQTIIPLWKKLNGVELRIAGTGSYEEALRKMASGNPRIKFLGPCSQADLAKHYRDAQACIVPSITYETFGIICIEAFANGTPVIARNLGALPEILEASKGGIVFDSDDEFLAAVNQILASSKLRKQLGENGHHAYLKEWTAEAHLRKYFQLIETTARKKFGRVPWQTSANKMSTLGDPPQAQEFFQQGMIH